ncbi:MAG: hypothetical protein WKF51_08235 [Geodermatophilaceae bacterium]
MEITEELAMHYAVARRDRPLASSDQIAERMLGWLTEDQELQLASQAQLWSAEQASTRELALLAVRNFVEAWEGDPDAP